MSPFDFDPVIEDHRHRILKNGECQGTEEKHGEEQNAPHDLFMSEEGPYLLDQSS